MATTVSHRLSPTQAHAIADLTGYEDADTLRWQQACVQAANQLTALPNGRYVHVRMERMRQGLELAQRGAVTLATSPDELTATVRSGSKIYTVRTGLLNCNCADYEKHLQACKHLLAVEIHLGVLTTYPSSEAEPPTAPAAPAVAAPPADVSPTPIILPAEAAPCQPTGPTAAQWPTSEAPASMNVQLKVGSMQLMYTARDTNDRDLQDRMARVLPWLAEVMAACEANYDARQQATKAAAESPRPTPQQRTLEEQIAAAVQAALKAQAPPTNPNGQRQPPPRDPMVAPTNDTDPSWCPIHRVLMQRRTNDRGAWYSHRLDSGAYCKGQ
jgi:hypothetical protein